jgi:hypothetical protein
MAEHSYIIPILSLLEPVPSSDQRIIILYRVRQASGEGTKKMPTHISLTQDPHAPKTEEGAKDAPSSNNIPASKSWKSDPKKSQNGKRPSKAPLLSSARPRIREPTTSRGVEYYPIPRPWSEDRNSPRGQFREPAGDSPMKRWQLGSAREGPWNSILEVYAQDLERKHRVHGRNDNLTLKDDSSVRVDLTENSNRTSSGLEECRDGSVCEAGDWAGLVAVGTWMK